MTNLINEACRQYLTKVLPHSCMYHVKIMMELEGGLSDSKYASSFDYVRLTMPENGSCLMMQQLSTHCVRYNADDVDRRCATIMTEFLIRPLFTWIISRNWTSTRGIKISQLLWLLTHLRQRGWFGNPPVELYFKE
jgi:hypothetical protein